MSNDVNKLTVVLEGNSEKLQKALAAANQSMQKFDKQSKKVGGTNGSGGALGGILATAKKLAPALSAAFAVREIGMFGKEAIMLGAKLEGIKNAFQLIEDTGKTSLTELKKATRGAVDEMTLMGLAVQANNFKVPLENLGSFFEFATIRAAQTGESVEYLTRSIVTGIGRKSPLILDNLGITLVRLKEAMGKVGRESASVADISAAVAKIAKEETGALVALGLASETSAQKISKLQASFKNFKAELGEDITDSGFFDSFLKGIGKIQDNSSLVRIMDELREKLSITGEETSAMFRKYIRAGLSKEEAELKIVETLQNRVLGLKKVDKIKAISEYGDPSQLSTIKELDEWYKKVQEDFTTFKLPFLGKDSAEAKALKSLYETREEQLNDIEVAEKKLSDSQKDFFEKYKRQLKEIKIREDNDRISPLDAALAKQKQLSEALTLAEADHEGLSLTTSSTYGQFQSDLIKTTEEVANLRLELAGLTADQLETKWMEDYTEGISEQIAFARSKIDIDRVKNGKDDDMPQLDEEEISASSQAGMDWAASLDLINKKQKDGIITEKEAFSQRQAALDGYINSLYEAGEEIPEWMKSLNDSMKGSLFDKDNLQELSQMWSGLASSLGQLAGAFNPDSGIAKFLRLGQSIAAAAAAMAALGAVFDPTAPARSIGAAVAVAGALAGVVGSIGNISGGFGGNGGGAGYNAALASGGQLYTDIRGRDLRILLDREGKFSDRRGG